MAISGQICKYQEFWKCRVANLTDFPTVALLVLLRQGEGSCKFWYSLVEEWKMVPPEEGVRFTIADPEQFAMVLISLYARVLRKP